MTVANARVTLDLARDVGDDGLVHINLDEYFTGRVGDSESWLPFQIKDYGRPANLSKYSIVAQGNDPDGHPYTFYGDARDDRRFDDMKQGRFTFYFPAGSFNVPGQWTDFFIRIIDGEDVQKYNTVVSTLSCQLTVSPEHVNMTITREAYDSKMESELDIFKKYLADTKEQLDQEAKGLSTKYPELTAKMQLLKAMDNDVKEMITKNQVATIQDLGTNVLENDMGNLPTPAMYIEKGPYKVYYGYCMLGDLDITPGQQISDTDLDETARIDTTVLNGRVVQKAILTSGDAVWEICRRSISDTSWSKWVIDTKFY